MGKIADLFNGFTLPQKPRTQLLVADKLFGELESKIEAIRAENLKLRADVNPLKRDNEKLQGEIARLTDELEKCKNRRGMVMVPLVRR